MKMSEEDFIEEKTTEIADVFLKDYLTRSVRRAIKTGIEYGSRPKEVKDVYTVEHSSNLCSVYKNGEYTGLNLWHGGIKNLKQEEVKELADLIADHLNNKELHDVYSKGSER